ncbi:hypothetical protein F4809DRAFT_629933 [Biscogniauxia mediterranea]|nr:hypothetical protein F4809DRAFT_629933 [Biscogniauxia mediterranea]
MSGREPRGWQLNKVSCCYYKRILNFGVLLFPFSVDPFSRSFYQLVLLVFLSFLFFFLFSFFVGSVSFLVRYKRTSYFFFYLCTYLGNTCQYINAYYYVSCRKRDRKLPCLAILSLRIGGSSWLTCVPSCVTCIGCLGYNDILIHAARPSSMDRCCD